jgi:hypothetical protein
MRSIERSTNSMGSLTMQASADPTGSHLPPGKSHHPDKGVPGGRRQLRRRVRWGEMTPPTPTRTGWLIEAKVVVKGPKSSMGPRYRRRPGGGIRVTKRIVDKSLSYNALRRIFILPARHGFGLTCPRGVDIVAADSCGFSRFGTCRDDRIRLLAVAHFRRWYGATPPEVFVYVPCVGPVAWAVVRTGG